MLNATIDYLTLALGTIIALFDPGVVVVGGQVGQQRQLLLDPAIAQVTERLPFVPPIVASQLKMDAAILGAVRLAIDETSDLLRVGPLHS